MARGYDDAVTELYQAPHAEFVAERKRLAGELKAAGDKEAAGKLAKLPRPPISAWTVNQLWWHARDAFEAMLASAEKVRDGDLSAAAAHRETIAKLRARAGKILEDAGNAAAESTLRRVTTTLAAVAATGGFDPDPPGMLGEDRDPPGFETMGIAAAAAPAVAAEKPKPEKPAKKPDEDDDDGGGRKAIAEAKRQREADEARERAEAAAERRRAEQEEARKKAERHRVEAALRTATGEVDRRRRDVERLREAVVEAEAKLEQSLAIESELAAKLDELA